MKKTSQSTLAITAKFLLFCCDFDREWDSKGGVMVKRVESW